MPTRETHQIVPQLSRYIETSWNGSSLSTAATQSVTLIDVEAFYRRWYNTPNYKRIKREGGRLPNNGFAEYRLSMTPVKVTGTGGSRIGNQWTLREGVRTYSLGGPNLPESFASLNAELTLKALGKAKQSSFNAPIFFAEAGKTTDMIMDRIADIRNLARTLRRGNVSDFLTQSRLFYDEVRRRRRIRGLPDYPPDWRVREVEKRFNKDFGRDAQLAAGNLWLEWKYGWQSLMMDVEGLAEHIEKTRSKDENLDGEIRTSVTRRTKTTKPWTLEVSPSCTGTIDESLTMKGNLICRFKMDNPKMQLPAKLGFTNPLSVAWELVPFSFVVDWFLPIGKFIDALDVHFLYTFTDKILVNKAIYTQEVTAKKSDLFNYGVSGSGRKLLITKNRDTANMSLSFSSLQWKNGFAKPERLFTSLALLGQTLSGFKHPTHGISPPRKIGASRPPSDWSNW